MSCAPCLLGAPCPGQVQTLRAFGLLDGRDPGDAVGRDNAALIVPARMAAAIVARLVAWLNTSATATKSNNIEEDPLETRSRFLRFAAGAAVMCVGSTALAQQSGLNVPARTLPVPTVDVSPEVQKVIALPLRKDWDLLPKTGEEWKPIVEAAAANAIKNVVPGLREQMKVKVEPTTIDGVKAFILTPETITPVNQNRVVIHMHGGCYVLSPGEAGLPEGLMMAGFGGIKVISVDYRMPPTAYFPAALDDGVTVYKSLLKTMNAKNVGFIGTSAGGALVLEMGLRAKQLNLPMPGAIASGTPMSDVTKVGDTFYTNELVDNVLVSRDGFCDAAAKVYANGHDMKDPLISPVYGDYAGFAPTILTSGTRDLLLSNTVRVHRKLRDAGVESFLQVFEGQSHAHYLRDANAPETKATFREIGLFFDKHMAR
jgi:monoterpene epsilon-lactone hydrolase